MVPGAWECMGPCRHEVQDRVVPEGGHTQSDDDSVCPEGNLEVPSWSAAVSDCD